MRHHAQADACAVGSGPRRTAPRPRAALGAQLHAVGAAAERPRTRERSVPVHSGSACRSPSRLVSSATGDAAAMSAAALAFSVLRWRDSARAAGSRCARPRSGASRRAACRWRRRCPPGVAPGTRRRAAREGARGGRKKRASFLRQAAGEALDGGLVLAGGMEAEREVDVLVRERAPGCPRCRGRARTCARSRSGTGRGRAQTVSRSRGSAGSRRGAAASGTWRRPASARRRASAGTRPRRTRRPAPRRGRRRPGCGRTARRRAPAPPRSPTRARPAPRRRAGSGRVRPARRGRSRTATRYGPAPSRDGR